MNYSRDQLMVDMYREYLQELENYGPVTITAKEALKSYSNQWHQVKYIFHDGKAVGFLIIGQAPDCHPDCDYFICQAYIRPEYRNLGLMSEFIKSFVNGHPGRYCLDVLYRNNYAIWFWHKRFKELGYGEITLPFIEHGVTGIAQTLFFEKYGR